MFSPHFLPELPRKPKDPECTVLPRAAVPGGAVVLYRGRVPAKPASAGGPETQTENRVDTKMRPEAVCRSESIGVSSPEAAISLFIQGVLAPQRLSGLLRLWF